MKIQTLGSFTVHKVLEVEQAAPLKMALDEVTAADLAELKHWYWDRFLAATPQESQLQISIHSFVVRCRGRNILIDGCIGNHKRRSLSFADNLSTPYLERLRDCGLTPSDIDVVMCTHLHGDHVGWNTRLQDGRWIPTFPNARYLFTRPDVEYFGAHRDEPFHGEAFEDSVLPIMEAGQADIVEPGHSLEIELGDGLWMEGAPGHSPGSCIIHVRSQGAHGIFSGDVFHHPIEVMRPSLRFFADLDPELTARTRTRLFEKYVDTDTRFFPAHFLSPTVGRIRSRGETFAYEFL
jgi:glyoxylase-like metal-dependent hydrolase (beta-lactamase superfamily II)